MLKHVCTGEGGEAMLRSAVAAAVVGGNSTDRMQARAGRAAHVPAQHWQGVKDPGALAVGIWLEAIEAALYGNVARHASEGWE